MEKKLRHYDLESFQKEFCDPSTLRMTNTASTNALELGMSRKDVVAMIQSMRQSHFYKSMTSHVDHKVWQDVYHVPWADLILYVKLTVDDTGRLLLQLKEK